MATKGHWPAGKRRNKLESWSETRLLLTHLIEDEWRQGVRTKCACAAAIGVDDRTVRRWLDGTDVPTQERQVLVRAWCTTQTKALKRERKESSV